MPEQAGSRAGVMAVPVNSGQTRRAVSSSPSAAYHPNNDCNSAGLSDLSTHHDSTTDHHDDTSGQHSKGSKAKPSDTLRRSQACLACRKRKLRCDAKKPTCTRCEKAWLAYHPAADASGSSKASPPPCEYDTSLLAKIFKKGGSSDPPTASSTSEPSAFRYRDTEEQLVEENEQLRAQISYLQGQLRRDDGASSPLLTGDSATMRSYHQSDSTTATTTASAASKLSVQSLTDTRHEDARYHKRIRSSNDRDLDTNRPARSVGSSTFQQQQPASTRRTSPTNAANPPFVTSTTEKSCQPRISPVAPSVFDRASAGKGQGPGPSPLLYRSDSLVRSPADLIPSAQGASPPLPNRQALDHIIETCRRESWLFAAINCNTFGDVAALLEATPSAESDLLTARALMLATVAIGLPLVASAFPKGKSSSPVFKGIDELLRAHLQLNLVRLDDPLWMSTVTKIYVDGARDLLNQAQTSSVCFMTPATFIVRLLVVECSHSHVSIQSAQADLALAATEARLLHLHSAVPGTHPRLSTGPARSSRPAIALRGLLQSKEESFAFWCLFLHDCFQSRLSLLPTTIERQTIKAAFPRSTDTDGTTPTQHSLDEVEAYIARRRGLPLLEPLDNSLSLLIKVGLVLDQCCEHAIQVRQKPLAPTSAAGRSAAAQDQRQNAFLAAHESIRNSRMMLSRFDDRTLSRSDRFRAGANSGRSRESLVSTLVLQDPMRFAAEVTHHLAVLTLFETAMNVVDPFFPAEEARGIICNASVWLSRLAGMALQNAPLLFALPSFCSSAFFVGARWLLFLQGADPEHFHADISTLVLLLSRRGERFSRDQSTDADYHRTSYFLPPSIVLTDLLAKAIVALKRELDFYGRICISPFTWPIEAVSKFISFIRQDAVRARQVPKPQAAEPGFVSIATLASSIEDAAVVELADAPSPSLG
ncbi:uncharacterized protein UTRI_10629 [Ustilago trichophora]|uniref:Zn(2)-C6 fungal-type domain-containing protein n=1 Tax=Ustilago trichophora TaxID=86804 RepID=A0A5C3EA79_9BASI|nr:uncharacterized protein UTRI_10629 [Ustilago trichophora]